MRRSLIAAIATISVAGFGLSMAYPLYSLLLGRMGASGWQIGLVNAAPAVAMLTVSPLLPAALSRISLPTLLTLAALVSAAAFVALKAYESVWAWALLRFVLGGSATAAFFGSELWIMTAAPAARRGFFIGLYGLCLSLGFVAGPSVLWLMDIEGWGPFVAGAALSLLSIAPVIWAWRDAPTGLGGPPQPLAGTARFFRTDPSVMFAVVLFGAVEFGGFALLPAWGEARGLTEAAAIGMIFWIALGNTVLQLPMGWTADRVNRKGLLALAALVCVIGPMQILGAVEAPARMALTLLIFGGISVALYTVSLAELSNRYSGEALARGTGALMVAYGVGSLIGPSSFGLAMDLVRPDGVLYAMSAVSVVYLLLMAWRLRARA
ncbi:MAG: MFS transporter [Pseudomonadota bacterium]